MPDAERPSAIAYVRPRRAADSSAEAQRRDLRAWSRRARARIEKWFTETDAAADLDERTEVARALSVLGPATPVLAVSRPAELDERPWARAVVEHVARYPAGRAAYARRTGPAR